MTPLISALSCLLLTYIILALIAAVRRRPLSNTALKVVGFGALACFTALNLSDWPVGWLSSFWRDHSILGATIDTLLLGAVIYLSYKAVDLRNQEELDHKIAVAGRAGVVDHLVEVDVALALALAERSKVEDLWHDWNSDEWTRSGKALGWLRRNREIIHTDAGALTQQDPRSWPIIEPLSVEEWRRYLVDQCLRRIMAAIRDWAVVLTRSRDGQLDLIRLGDIRLQLILIDDYLETGQPAEAVEAVKECQEACRLLASAFELASKPHSPRPEVVGTREGSRPGSHLAMRQLQHRGLAQSRR
ncbi:MAG: hypothetical protein ACJ72G_04800 [Friedmanniella sp.]